MELKRIKERHYYRDYSAFNIEAYLNDINLINWSSISNGA
jgi:superoxide dismutase